MHKRNRIFSFFLVVVLLLCGITVKAKESTKTNKGSIVKEITFSTDDTVETLKKQKNDYFPETIKVDGKRYRLKTVDYKVLDKTPISIEKEVQKVVDSDFIPAGTEYQPEDAIEDNGVTYKLDKVETEEKTADDTYIQTVTGYTDYDHAVSRSDVPATKNVTATNQRTGQQETVTCNLSSIDQIGSSGWEDTYIDIVFESYDAQIFHWNGITVTKDVSSPLAGYENNLLASVGADSSSYQVLRTYWTGDAYRDSNGVLCRNARADVQRKVNYYRANYSGQIQQPETPGHVYHSTYTGTEKITSEDKYSYTIKAAAEYEEINNLLVYALSGVSILLLIIIVILILYIVSKKKEKKEPKVQYIEKENKGGKVKCSN